MAGFEPIVHPRLLRALFKCADGMVPVWEHLRRESRSGNADLLEAEAEMNNLGLSRRRLDEFWMALAQADRALAPHQRLPLDLALQFTQNVVICVLLEFVPIMERDARIPGATWLGVLIAALRWPTLPTRAGVAGRNSRRSAIALSSFVAIPSRRITGTKSPGRPQTIWSCCVPG